MKYLKKFDELGFYNKDFKSILPNELTIIKDGKTNIYHKGNIMKNASMIQITYINNEVWGEPETLEMDLYIVDHIKYSKIDVEITHGDEVVSSFSVVPPNTISNTIEDKFYSKSSFGFTKESLQNILDFFNKLNVGFELTMDNFTFLKG